MSKTNTSTILTDLTRSVLTDPNQTLTDVVTDGGGFEISDMLVGLYNVIDWTQVLSGADNGFTVNDIRSMVPTEISLAKINQEILDFVNGSGGDGTQPIPVLTNPLATIGKVDEMAEYSLSLPIFKGGNKTLTHLLLEVDNIATSKHAPAFVNEDQLTDSEGNLATDILGTPIFSSGY